MIENITIRPAHIRDMDVLLAFEQEIIAVERPFDPTIKDSPVSYYNLKALLNNPNAYLIVACHNDVIVSCGYGMEKKAKVYLDHDTYAYLGSMYTLPEYRGHGINALVIERLKKWAFSKGLKEVRLTVYNDNESAISAYEKVGFKRHIVEMRLEIKE